MLFDLPSNGSFCLQIYIVGLSRSSGYDHVHDKMKFNSVDRKPNRLYVGILKGFINKITLMLMRSEFPDLD